MLLFSPFKSWLVQVGHHKPVALPSGKGNHGNKACLTGSYCHTSKPTVKVKKIQRPPTRHRMQDSCMSFRQGHGAILGYLPDSTYNAVSRCQTRHEASDKVCPGFGVVTLALQCGLCTTLAGNSICTSSVEAVLITFIMPSTGVMHCYKKAGGEIGR